jgi:hypothetical protein
MLAFDSTTSVFFSGVLASRSGSRAATTSLREKALTTFLTCSQGVLWQSHTKSNKFGECSFNINWWRKNNDEVRNHSLLEQ